MIINNSAVLKNATLKITIGCLILLLFAAPSTTLAKGTIDEEIESDLARIEKLMTKRRPVSLALTRRRLGRLFINRGRRDNSITDLEMALRTLDQTETLWSETRTPKKWAMIQYEKARAYEWMAELQDHDANMERALPRINAALAKRPTDAKDHKRARLELLRARILISSGISIVTGDSRVEAGYRGSSEIFARYTPNPKSYDWNRVLMSHGMVTRAFAIVKRSKELTRQAADLFSRAVENARNNRSEEQLAFARYQKGMALSYLCWLTDDITLALNASALFQLARPYHEKRGNKENLAALDAATAFSHILLATNSPKTYSAKESLESLINAEKVMRELNRTTIADRIASDIVRARRIVQRLGHW